MEIVRKLQNYRLYSKHIYKVTVCFNIKAILNDNEIKKNNASNCRENVNICKQSFSSLYFNLFINSSLDLPSLPKRTFKIGEEFPEMVYIVQVVFICLWIICSV